MIALDRTRLTGRLLLFPGGRTRRCARLRLRAGATCQTLNPRQCHPDPGKHAPRRPERRQPDCRIVGRPKPGTAIPAIRSPPTRAATVVARDPSKSATGVAHEPPAGRQGGRPAPASGPFARRGHSTLAIASCPVEYLHFFRL